MRTRDVRPWWWWVNPWLYIKRRDIAYDTALDSLYEMALDARYPERLDTPFDPSANPVFQSVEHRCRSCGLMYLKNAACTINSSNSRQ